MFRCTKGLGHIIPHSTFHPRSSLRHVSHVLYGNSTYAHSPCSDPSTQLQLPPTPQAWDSGQGIWLTRQNQLDNKWSQLRCSLITLRCEPLQHYFYFVSPRGGLSEGRVGKCKQAVRLEYSESPVPPTAPGLRQAWRLPRKGAVMKKSHWPEVKKPHEICTALECVTRKGSGEPPESRPSLTTYSGAGGTSLGENHQWSLPRECPAGIISGSLTACCVEALIPFPDRNSQRCAGSFCFLCKTPYNPHFTVCASASFYPHPSGSTLTPTHPTSVISSHSQLSTSFHFSIIGMPFLWASLFSAFKIQLRLYLLKHNLLILAWSLPFLVLALYSLLNMMFAKIISSLLHFSTWLSTP